MPPSPSKDEDENSSPSTPAAKRRVSQPNNTTPRRASANKPKAVATPIRKASGNAVKTPSTAPARTKTANNKKPEPTLLGDFLLGRPSPARQQRRKSLDAVRQELKAANVGTVKLPGGVQDRVKQWQKANAAAIVIEEDPNVKNEEEEKAAVTMGKVLEGVEGSADEDDRLRIKYRDAKRPGRRKSKEDVKDDVSEAHSRSTSAPKKRVISDEHWMKNRTPKKKSPKSGSQRIPKDFLAKTAVKEPLGHRVQEWIKISESHSASETEQGERKRPIRQELKFPRYDGIRVQPSPDDLKSPLKGDGIRITPLEESPPQTIPDDGIRVKPVRKDGSKRRPRVKKEVEEEEVETPTRQRDKHLEPSGNLTGKARASSRGSKNIILEEDDEVSALTPSPSIKLQRKNRKSDTPSDLSEIPFGNSAFSVLELPLGAEAGTMPSKRPPPKRTPSFGVPKVLKKVYNAVHDTSESPRGGPNQPASIESWLNGTSDPFVDRPTPPQSVVASSEATPSRSTSCKEVDQTEKELGAESEGAGNPRRRTRKSLEKIETEIPSPREPSPPLKNAKTRDTLPSMERSTPASPAALKRSPATRNTSSPKSVRKSTLKASIFDAFKGESAMAGQKGPHPFAEITGSTEREVNRSHSYSGEPIYEEEEELLKQDSHEKADTQVPLRMRQRPLPPLFRGPPPVGGGHRLSTIASVETFSTSTATDTASEISQTTITQDTLLSATTMSSLSRKSNNKPNKPDIKRRLTKHSDLMSVLSLPDSSQPGRATSIRSARSVRTTRTKLETATVQSIMREVAEDEAKYMRELKTLVDGVIPVLLTCVLSKSDAAKAAGLFNPNFSSGTDPTFTKPIVDMGVALERLKSLHNRIPLDNADAFITWAGQAHRSYEDYVVAWRTGFQDVVVNLAPSSRTPSGEKSALDDLPRNAAGDVVGANGERVDVAHLMKRPLVRTKYINKAIKGLAKIDGFCQQKANASKSWGDLEIFVRKRAKEEEARRVDQAANSTDSTRARDPRTFAPVDNVKIDQTRQVFAQDLFSFDISHSNGQQMSCQVEILVRDKASDPNDCDILICEVDSVRRFLLFPPMSKNTISARMGDNKNQLIVMIRGVHEASEWSEEWSEVFILESDEEGVAPEWLEMLGTVPMPPQVIRKPVDIDAVLSEISESINCMQQPETPTIEGDIPVGERHRREAEYVPPKARPQSSHSKLSSTPSAEESEVSDHVTERIVDLNDAMNKAGSLPAKRTRAARYHSKSKSASSAEMYLMSGALDPYLDSPSSNENDPTTPKSSPITTGLPYTPKLRTRSLPTTPERDGSTPLKESMRPEAETLKIQQPTKVDRNDGAPPPPPHRTLTPTGLKKTPVLDSPTPKAKARRSSSPLKHEYQPSDASDTTPDELSYSDSDSYTESSDEDELEALDMANAVAGPNIYGTKRVSPSGSMYSIPNSTLAPSNSASQGPYHGVPVQNRTAAPKMNMASISGWDNNLGKWVDLHKDPCSIVITPGLIQAFEMSAAHSSPTHDQSGDQESAHDSIPLLAQVVTPMVPLRQSNALDIEIRVKPNAGSAVKKSPEYMTIRYRAATTNDASTLYLSLHRARLENPVWLKLEEERRVNCFGTGNFRQSQNQRSSWSFFKRRKSYRASTRAPSVAPSEQSGKSGGSSFLQRLTGGGGEYNIAKSTVHAGAPGSSSAYTSNTSDYSGPTPPRTPSSPSIVNSSYSQAMLKNRGTEDLAIRLYQVHSTTKWEDMGPARLTVTLVPQGMRQASSLNHGIERRVIVTRKNSASFFDALANGFNDKPKNTNEYSTFLDIVLGADCFQIIGRTGVCATVWEDVMGSNGEVGMVGATGGLAGKTRRWLFQTSCQADAAHIYNICAIGGRGFRDN